MMTILADSMIPVAIVAAIVAEFVVGAPLLWVGSIYLARVQDVKFSQVVVAWGTAILIVVAIAMVLAFPAAMLQAEGVKLEPDLASAAQTALLLVSAAAMWFVIRSVLKTSLIRAIVAWLPTLATKLIIIPLVIVMSESGVANRADEMSMKVGAQKIEQALVRFQIDANRYPTEEEGLQALVDPPEWMMLRDQYLTEIPKDAWGRPLRYTPAPASYRDFNPRPYSIMSDGPDATPGTQDDILLGP